MPGIGLRTLFSARLFVLALVSVTLCVPALAEDRLVVFTATWCASCRDLMPVIERLASQRQLSLLLIDVDEPRAPKTAQGLGLEIPHRELPQVYLLRDSKASLVLDGSTYQLGQRRAAQLQLQRHLGE